MRVAAAALVVALAACAPSARAPSESAPLAKVERLTLVDTAGGTTTFPDDLGRSKVTVVVFYGDHCPCFRVHEERFRELERTFAARGVRVLFVDSEVSGNPERDARAAKERGLPAIVLDPGARLADALGADYATYTVVFDAQGRARYRGGPDSDKERLHDDATAYVKDAVVALLDGREPPVTEGKALGCALQKR